MKDFEQFITDEMLAAYLDGNAIPIEKNIIENNINNDEFQEILDIVSDIKDHPEIVEKAEGIDCDIPYLEVSPESLFQELKKEIDKPNNNII